MTIIASLAAITGVVLGLGGLPQAVKIFKTKSAKDISAATYFITEIGSVVWILYGFELKNLPIIIPNILGFILSTVILIGWYLYGRNSKKQSRR